MGDILNCTIEKRRNILVNDLAYVFYKMGPAHALITFNILTRIIQFDLPHQFQLNIIRLSMCNNKIMHIIREAGKLFDFKFILDAYVQHKSII